MSNIVLKEILGQYRSSGYSLRRITPQPHEPGSWEQQTIRILRNTGNITVSVFNAGMGN